MIPACNEAEGLQALRRKLEDLHLTLGQRFEMEYCIVDDGSTDATPANLCDATPSNARCVVLSHVCNFGLGAAFRTGFAHVDADVVCTIDADCSYSPNELLSLIALIEDGHADIAVASPYHPEGRVDGVEKWRLAISLRCSALYRMALPLKLHTYTSMCRAYRGSILRSVQFPSNGFVSTVEILLSAAGQGYRIAEVPATLCRRTTGVSKMRMVRTVRAHLSLLGRCARARLSSQKYPELKGPRSEDEARLLSVFVRNGFEELVPVLGVHATDRTLAAKIARAKTGLLEIPMTTQA